MLEAGFSGGRAVPLHCPPRSSSTLLPPGPPRRGGTHGPPDVLSKVPRANTVPPRALGAVLVLLPFSRAPEELQLLVNNSSIRQRVRWATCGEPFGSTKVS